MHGERINFNKEFIRTHNTRSQFSQVYFELNYIGYTLTRYNFDFPQCHHSQGHSSFLVSTTLIRLRSVNRYSCSVFVAPKLISVLFVFYSKAGFQERDIMNN
jgi:hypothetical protein